MAVSKAQQKASNKYIAENYDKTTLAMRKGIKEVWQAEAKKRNLSFNAFIQYCVDFTVKQENEVYLTSNGLTAEYCIVQYSKEFKSLKEVRNFQLSDLEKTIIFKSESKETTKELFEDYKKSNNVNQSIKDKSVIYTVSLFGLENHLINEKGEVVTTETLAPIYNIEKLIEDF